MTSTSNFVLALFCTTASCILPSSLAAGEGFINETQEISLSGRCPNISYLIFPLEELSGFWYRPYSTRKLKESTECDGDCVTVNIIPDELSYKMDVCCRKGNNVKCGKSVGSGHVRYHPTVLGGGFYENNGDIGPLPLRTDFYILDADSTKNASYLITYSCQATENGLRQEFAEVLTRDPGLTDSFITKVFDVYTKIGFKTTKLIHSSQGLNCPYVKFE